VHTDQSGDAKQSAPAAAVFDYAFKPFAQGGAGLDFVQATDHNTDAGWGEWGRHQAHYPGKLIARNEEITTYRGHINSPGTTALADYRTGRVYERLPNGALALLRAARPASQIFDAVHAAGGIATINHPTIFDARVPPFAIICRGCSWEYTDAETDYRKVDAIEVETGPQGLKLGTFPGPNPFTPLAVRFYDDAAQLAGHTVAAVSGSDSHTGGNSSPSDVTGTPVGSPATMVYAEELSEQGIARAVRAGHTYVRSFGMRSPELRLEARPAGRASPTAIMGDTLHAAVANLTVRVIGKGAGPEPLVAVVTRNGIPRKLIPVTSTNFTKTVWVTAPAVGAARIGLIVLRGTAIEAFATPIRIAR
jgi:hypothetical protein